jgi:hypothetical protein
MITGCMTVNIFEVTNQALVKTLTVGPFSCLKLKQNIFYEMKNASDEELICFFFRDTHNA